MEGSAEQKGGVDIVNVEKEAVQEMQPMDDDDHSNEHTTTAAASPAVKDEMEEVEEEGSDEGGEDLVDDLAVAAAAVAASFAHTSNKEEDPMPAGADKDVNIQTESMCLENVAAALVVPAVSTQSADADQAAQEEESSSSDDIDTSDDDEPDQKSRATVAASDDEDDGGQAAQVPRTKNEIVPPAPPKPEIENVEGEIQHLGSISGVLENTVIVQAAAGPPALDEETMLCFEDRKPLGLVAEIFGPIYEPLYIVRFVSAQDMDAERTVVGKPIYFAKSMSKPVDQASCRIKGSDASNIYDEEPAPDEVEYSDDEAEAEAKAKKKDSKRKAHDNTSGDHNNNNASGGKSRPERGGGRGRGRGQGRGNGRDGNGPRPKGESDVGRGVGTFQFQGPQGAVGRGGPPPGTPYYFQGPPPGNFHGGSGRGGYVHGQFPGGPPPFLGAPMGGPGPFPPDHQQRFGPPGFPYPPPGQQPPYNGQPYPPQGGYYPQQPGYGWQNPPPR